MNESEITYDLAIRKALSYRAVFLYPLSFYQLGTYLLCEESPDTFCLRDAVTYSQKRGIVRAKKGKFFLRNVMPVNWDARARDSRKTLDYHQGTFKILGKIPWLKLLAVTGATAAFNFKKGDDLDVFIIAQKNRVWLTRFFVVLLLKAMGRYRSDKLADNKICPNLFISEDNLTWDPEKQNVHVAHEIVMMHPFINRDDTYFKFIKANDWVFKYFGNVAFSFPDSFQSKPHRSSKLLDLAEYLFMKIQLWYMCKRKTVELTSTKIIHFNKNDNSRKILAKYQRIYTKAIKSS